MAMTTCQELLPGLIDEVAYLCLLRVPLAYHGHMRKVCRRWNQILNARQFYNDRILRQLEQEWIYALVRDNKLKNSWWAFDPHFKLWLKLPPMPDSRQSHAVGQECRSLCGKLIVCGGWHETPLDDVTIFDPKTNCWTSATPMLSPRAHFVSGEMKHQLYVAGGSDGWQPRSQTAECYDPFENNWRPMPVAETGISFCLGITLDDKLFVKARGGSPKQTQMFWPELNLWSSLETRMLDEPTSLHAVLDGKLYRLDVLNHGYIMKLYEMETDTWKSLSYFRHFFVGQQSIQDVVACSGKLWAVGSDFGVVVIEVHNTQATAYVSLERGSALMSPSCEKIVKCLVMRA
ncbi:hypothetical protein O6H91_05G019500 [Diphasiastrum complanatum]|uniref:Uncharacterized protein n=1 Tax=Diphasiastrum complanatum TaxID=34168 RepID=A0ACC2DLI0_DIPCM|nr:hypothetical protein O6H91_05G019500 [Diphasiastrum complanatum]